MTLPIDAFDFFFFYYFSGISVPFNMRRKYFIYLFIFSFVGSFEDLLKLDEETAVMYGFLHKIYILRTSQTWFQLARL